MKEVVGVGQSRDLKQQNPRFNIKPVLLPALTARWMWDMRCRQQLCTVNRKISRGEKSTSHLAMQCYRLCVVGEN